MKITKFVLLFESRMILDKMGSAKGAQEQPA